MPPKKSPFIPSSRNDPVSPTEVASLKRDVSNFLSKVMDYAIKLPASERATNGFPSVDVMKDVKKRGQQAAREAEKSAKTSRALRQSEADTATIEGPTRVKKVRQKRREKFMRKTGNDVQHQWGRDWKRAEDKEVVENDKFFFVLGENGRDVLYLPGRY